MTVNPKDDEIEQNDVVIVQDDPEVDAGEIDSSKEADSEKVVQKKAPTRKRGNDQQKRLNEIWLGRKEAEAEAQRQANLAAQERSKNAQYEQITASALEENINTKRELLKERLVRAQEVQDPNKIAEIQVELGKVEAQSAQIERYKIENKVQPQQKQEAQSYEHVNPVKAKWLEENQGWYDPSSETYDPEKSHDVTLYAASLEANPSFDAPIGSRAYFNKINEYITKNWGSDVQDDEEEDEAPVAPQKKNFAAPVGNRSAGTPNQGARREYKITQAEKELALSLDSKGAGGKPLSDNDKIKRFINLREKTPASGPISIETLRGAN